VQLIDELSRNLNETMLSSHAVDKEKTLVIDEMQQYVTASHHVLCVMVMCHIKQV